jgi:ribosomal protein S18 acetylase RimI-like enzyme
MPDPTASLAFRHATIADAALLAQMNHRLIRDEGHRSRMTVPQLRDRMDEWLRGEYRAVVIELGGAAVGYALYRLEPEYVYLRQFYVEPEHRRRGIGRTALAWLRAHAWADAPRIRIDVLVGNAAGIAFWRTVGFRDYCLTMEWE